MRLTFIIIFAASITSFGQTWDEFIYQGKKEREMGNFKKAGELIARGAELKKTKNFEHYYYAATMFANAHDFESSFKMLEKCIETGMYDLARWERNSRLKVLHGEKRWTELMTKMRVSESSYVASLSHPGLRRELKKMWKMDQDLVGQWDEQKVITDQNTERLNEMIEQYGWPNRGMIGKDGVWLAWAIAQHSHDLNFQKKCQKLLKQTLSTNMPEPVLYAELNDRICRNTNQKQKFGMAIIEKDGTKMFYPISKESEVDKRRKSIGLGPIKVYANENYVAYPK